MRDAAATIIKTLIQNGYQAYLVGGCVRDLLLGREPKDFDVTTNATPEQVMRLFPESIPVEQPSALWLLLKTVITLKLLRSALMVRTATHVVLTTSPTAPTSKKTSSVAISR